MKIKQIEKDKVSTPVTQFLDYFSKVAKKNKNKINKSFILNKLSQIEFTEDEYDSLIYSLINSGIEIIEDEDLENSNNDDESNDDKEIDDDVSLEDKKYTHNIEKYLDDLSNHVLLTKEQEIELAKRIKKGDTYARYQLIDSNYGLVKKEAWKNIKKGFSFLELFQAGCIGLIKAVDRYDYKRENRFSTYATWWIKQEILNYISKLSGIVRVPSHLLELRKKVNKASNELEQLSGKQPSEEEIANYIGNDITADDVRKVQSIIVDSSSLDETCGDDKDTTLSDFVVDPDDSIIKFIDDEKDREKLIASLNKLKENEKRVLSLYYGLQNGEEKTLQAIGDILHISKERVRQIKDTALSKLKDLMFDKPET